jgi:hypothetical protein
MSEALLDKEWERLVWYSEDWFKGVPSVPTRRNMMVVQICQHQRHVTKRLR